MSGFGRLVHEVHRRSLWQVLALYLAGSWVALQVVNEVAESVGLPEWVSGAAVVLLVIGFPIVLATAFVQEGTGVSRKAAVDGPGREATATGADPAATGHAARPDAEMATAAAAPPGPGRRHRLFTWRNAIMGGVMAFALLGLFTAGYMALRTLGIGPAGTLVAKGVLEERPTILVADFASTDSLLGRAATEAIRVDLSQSPAVRLAEPAFVGDALRRMGREAGGALDAGTARELAQREGLPAVLAGEINPAGGRYLISGELVAPADGRVLVSHKEIAADSSEILSAIDALSRRLRERIGESIRSLRADPPLERVSTESLEALRKYSLAVEAIDMEAEDARGIALLEEAIALDPGFAMAHRKLGVVLRNRAQERARMIEALNRAYEHRARLTERERYMAVAAYHQTVTGDLNQAVAAYQNLLEIDPDDVGATNNLGVLYEMLRDPARAEELYMRAVQLDSISIHPVANLVSARFAQGDREGAAAALEAALARLPDNPAVRWFDHLLAGAVGRYDEAMEAARSFRVRFGADPYQRALVSRDLASLAAAQGRLSEAGTYLRDARLANEERGAEPEMLSVAIQEAWMDLVVRRDPGRAVAGLDEGLARVPLAGIDPLDRPYPHLAEVLAFAGREGRARGLLQAFEAEVPPELRLGEGVRAAAHRARGALALAEGDAAGAIEEYRRSDRGPCEVCALPGLAAAYEAAGERDSVLAVYTRFIETPELYRFWGEGQPVIGPAMGPAHERLAELHDDAGDLERAAEHYARFVELWSDADPELQPRVRAAQERLEEIVAERG